MISVVTIAVFGDPAGRRRAPARHRSAAVCRRHADHRLGAMFRTFASVTWGWGIYTLPTPFNGVTTVAGVTLSHQYHSIIVGTLILCGALYGFFNHTRIGIAIRPGRPASCGASNADRRRHGLAVALEASPPPCN